MDGKLAGFLIYEFIDLLSEHLDRFARDVGTEESIELIETFEADECAGEQETVFRIHDLLDGLVEIIEVVKAGVRIDVTHVTEEFLYTCQCDAIADRLAEQGSKIVYVCVVDRCEVSSVITDDNVYAVDAFDVVVYVFVVGITGNETDGAL